MKRPWWKEAIAYQIYPKTFHDSHQSGIGDLNGIIEKLPYLADLGVDVIWLTPFFPSPMIDNGYDISDYTDVDPRFGTLQDAKRLVDEAKQLGIKVLIDLVYNHSSSDHPWFREALSDANSPYRDFYIIKKGVPNPSTEKADPPNNWRSIFGGSAWEPMDDNYFYLHTFHAKQPDLNWENEALVSSLIQATNFWLDLGVSGFRIDAITFIKKDNYSSLGPDQKDGLVDIGKATLDRPGIHALLQKLKSESYGKGDYMTVAEAPGVKLGDLEPYIGDEGDFSMIFEFSPMEISLNPDGAWYPRVPWDNNKHRNLLYKSQLAIQEVGWMALFLENHDMPRCIDRCFGIQDDSFQKGSLLALMYFFMRGTPFIYQGQEIGLRNHPFTSIDEFNDISTLDQYRRAIDLGASEEVALRIANEKSRDHARTFIPWEEVERQKGDPDSLLNFYKELIRIRKDNPDALVYGSFRPIYDYYDLLFAYERIGKRELYTVLCNFSDRTIEIPWHYANEIIISNSRKIARNETMLILGPYEGILLKRLLQ